MKVLPGGGYLKKNIPHTFSGRHLSRHFYKAFAFSLCVIYAHRHTYMYTHMHTPCFHVIAGNVGRKTYINMF